MSWVLLAVALAGGSLAAGEEPGAPAEASLRARVERQLRAHLPDAGKTIEVTAQRGQVALGGWVDAFVKRQVAQELAESVPGVSAVVNHILVQPVGQRSDERVAESVRAAIRGDIITRALEIEVAVDHGVVRLGGEVPSEPQRRAVEWLVSQLVGVRDVVNQIQIDPEPRNDDAIARELRQHFAQSVTFNDNDVSVEVHDGVAHVRGTVDSALEKNWAQTDAWVSGVRQVDASELRVAFPQGGWRAKPVTRVPMSDEQVREAIKRQYVYDPRVPSVEPRVEVRDGIVTLSGAVSHRVVKQAALEIARHVGGVKQVIDHLVVRPEEQRSDAEIAAALRTALEMNSAVDADDVDVQVSRGAVRLRGTVADALAKWTAENVADRTSGVVAVENQLRTAHEPLPEVEYYHFPRGYAFRPANAGTRPAATGSDDLVAAVRAQLARSRFAELRDIDVRADGRNVTLEGEVKSQPARRAAEDRARQAGAQNVVNRLRVMKATE